MNRAYLLALVITTTLFFFGCGGGNGSSSDKFNQTPPSPRIPIAAKLNGLNLGPFVIASQDPNKGSVVPANQLSYLLRTIQPYTQWIRTFGTGNGLQHAGQVAHNLGLKTAIGAFLSTDLNANQTEINNLIQASHNGEVDVAVVGNEVLLNTDTTGQGLSEDQLLAYIAQVKQQVPANVRVTTVDTWNELVNHPRILVAVDLILGNFYPFYENATADQALATLQNDYQKLKQAAGNKEVWVAETGWPSQGAPPSFSPNAVPSTQNQATYFVNAVRWARSSNIPLFWFEAFDEPWKADYSDYASWGILNSSFQIKPGLDPGFTSP